jgi:tetratricopeptide (TPR) repeat protein/transcriptional regulator with XRE-family HTH domain
VRAFREQALLTQEQLAARSGLSVGAIRGLESGRIRRPRTESLRLLAQALDLAESDRRTLITVARDESTNTGPRQQARQAARPAQLPASATSFTGRTDALKILDGMLPNSVDAPSGLLILLAVAGTAGVGKTALAVHWAHRVANRFPDGQLFIDLRGWAPDAPLRPIDALARLLPALGVPPDQVPTGVDEAAAMYRSHLAGRRMLVLLDNAASAEQVRPLLPGSGGCLVLVTSRDLLAGLVANEGAHRLVLHILSRAEAHDLMTSRLGAERTETEHHAVAQVAELCGHLPLALRIAAANLAARPTQRIADYAEQLRPRDRLTALAAPGDPHNAVSAVFDLSYSRIPDPARRLFRLVGLAPGPDVTAEAAGALADIGAERAAPLLELLAGAHLVHEHAPGRYTHHDLLRHYANHRAHHEESAKERHAARERLFSYYLTTIHAAAGLLYPAKERLALPTGPDRPASPPIRDQPEALAWLDDELPSLVAAIRHAATRGPRPMAWLLADSLRGYFWLRRCTVEWLAVAETALEAAVADGDPRGQTAARLSLADAHVVICRHTEAIEQYRHALSTNEEQGSVGMQCAIMNNIGTVYLATGRPQEAADYHTRVLEICRRTEDHLGEAVQLGNLGAVYRTIGQLESAADHHRRALGIYRRLGDPMFEAGEQQELGYTYLLLGRFDQALSLLNNALAHHRLNGDRSNEAETQRRLALLNQDLGRPSLALSCAVLAVARGLGNRNVEADALNTVATDHRLLGQHREAIEHHEQALRVAQETKLGPAQADALIGLATVQGELGDRELARGYLGRALGVARESRLRLLEARALTVLAGLHLAEGDDDEACRVGEQALALHRETGHRLGEAHTHVVLGHARERAGNGHAAQAHWRRAHTLFTELGTPESAETRALLAAT